MELKNVFDEISNLSIEEQAEYVNIINSILEISRKGYSKNISKKDIVDRLSAISSQAKVLVELWSDYDRFPVLNDEADDEFENGMTR